MSTVQDLSNAIQKCKIKEALNLVQQAIDEGVDTSVILNEGLIAPMDIIGEKFANDELFIPEMLMAANAMSSCIEVLKPHMGSDSTNSKGLVVIGSVAGDMHDIGKNLVRMMIEGKGFEVADLGVDVPPEKFVEFVQEHPETKIVALSALLTTTMQAMSDAVKALDEAGLREGRYVMVGGAPINKEFAAEIGADAYTADAGAAAIKAAELVA